MLSLLLTIISTSCIFLAFKSFRVFGMNSLHAIIVNYFVCVISGLIYLNDHLHHLFSSWASRPWYLYAIGLGLIFIFTFFRMSRTAQEISVSASSMASKLALVLPVLFSLLIIQRTTKDYDFINYLGIILTIPALMLASWPEKNESGRSFLSNISLPLSVFILSGIIDTSLNYFNSIYESDPAFVFFPMLVFFCAGSFGLLFIMFNSQSRGRLKLNSIIGGVYLGIPNFFSLYFLMETLKIFNQDGAFIFPFSNLGTIILASLVAFILFRENMSPIRLLGLFMACIALFLLAYQEFLMQFGYG